MKPRKAGVFAPAVMLRGTGLGTAMAPWGHWLDEIGLGGSRRNGAHGRLSSRPGPAPRSLVEPCGKIAPLTAPGPQQPAAVLFEWQ
jgi:hypothetical protein